MGQHLTAPAGRQSAPKAAGPPPKRRLPRPKPHQKRQKLPVDTSAPFSHYPAMLGETQKPILPHPRSAEYLRAREKQIPSPAQRQVQAGTPKTKFLSVDCKGVKESLL
jgi:hypothetical protein